MEKLYETFTNDLLPQIQDGLVISKDYFMDLFGRYIQYLLITDILLLVFTLTLFIIGCVLFYKGMKNCDTDERAMMLIGGGTLAIIMFIFVIAGTGDVIKDLYIPEIRVYEKIQYLNN